MLSKHGDSFPKFCGGPEHHTSDPKTKHEHAQLINKRARTVGANRIRHAFHCYQMVVNITILLRHAEQTGT